jgi:hypothetical protein
MGALVQEDTTTRAWTDDGDHERNAHYAPADEVMESLVNGTAIMALCGKIWIPHRDPNKYPICQTCKEIYEEISV